MPNIQKTWTEQLSKSPPLEEVQVDGLAYIAYNEGSGTWGHWLIHILPRVIIFLRMYPFGKVIIPDDYRYKKFQSCIQSL